MVVSISRRSRRSPLFPYTTLFRSARRTVRLMEYAARREGRRQGPAPPGPVPRREGAAGGEVGPPEGARRSEEHTSELQSPCNLVCRLLLEKKKKKKTTMTSIN